MKIGTVNIPQNNEQKFRTNTITRSKNFFPIIIILSLIFLIVGLSSFYIYNINLPKQSSISKDIVPNIKDFTLPLVKVEKYPEKIYPILNQDSLISLQKEFNTLNGPEWNVEFAPMGYIAFLSKIDPSNPNKPVFISKNIQKEINLWTEFIKKNAKYFGIDHPDNLHLSEGIKNNEPVLFATQNINGETPLFQDQLFQISLSNKQISGHFWPDAKLSLQTHYDTQKIKEKLLNKPYIYQVPPKHRLPCINCEEPLITPVLRTFTTSAENVKISEGPYIYTKDNKSGNAQQFELRQIAYIEIKLPEVTKFNLFDEVTGEKLK